MMNVMSCVVSDAIKETLWHYLSKAHVAEEDRKYIKMKIFCVTKDTINKGKRQATGKKRINNQNQCS